MFTPTELRATLSLSAVLAIRMLGLFIILPIFAIAATQLQGATPTLIGFTLGAYGLFQAIFQIPFGLWSDKIGRKTVITIGLLIFIVGSGLAALSHHIVGVMMGRALQGAGAIGSTLIAFVADFTHEKNRTKAMALLGMTIGIVFALAMVLGNFLYAGIGLAGIFWVCAVLAFLSLGIIWIIVPPAPVLAVHPDRETIPSLFSTVLKNKNLLSLNFGIACLHAILTASFIALPHLLQRYQLNFTQQGYVYLAALLVAFIAMVPLIILAEKYGKMRSIFLSAILSVALSLLLLAHINYFLMLIISLMLFFTAFNVLEAILPSQVSKLVPTQQRGTAMGIYSTCQFLGIFIGGSLGGWLYAQAGIAGIFIFCASLAIVWSILAWRIRF